jgi:hypothetical protein
MKHGPIAILEQLGAKFDIDDGIIIGVGINGTTILETCLKLLIGLTSITKLGLSYTGNSDAGWFSSAQ